MIWDAMFSFLMFCCGATAIIGTMFLAIMLPLSTIEEIQKKRFGDALIIAGITFLMYMGIFFVLDW